MQKVANNSDARYGPNMARKIIGYARVSTEDQDLRLQIDALKAHGCDPIVTDKGSGRSMDRKGVQAVIKGMRKGDKIVVWRLDRLGRNVMAGLQAIKLMSDRGVEFVSLNEQIDTTTATGKMMLGIFLVLAEWESNVIAERTAAGVKARQDARLPHGRPHSVLKYPARVEMMRGLRDSELLYSMTYAQIHDVLNGAGPKKDPIKSRTTVIRWVRAGYPGLDDDLED